MSWPLWGRLASRPNPNGRSLLGNGGQPQSEAGTELGVLVEETVDVGRGGQDQDQHMAMAPERREKRRLRLAQLQQRLRSRSGAAALARNGGGGGGRSMQSANARLCGLGDSVTIGRIPTPDDLFLAQRDGGD